MAGTSGVAAIVDKFKALERRDSERNESYDEVLQFYGGTTLRDAKKQGFLNGIAQSLTSIFQPRADDEDISVTTPINLVKPAIENKVAFLALPPTIRVIEPPDQYAPQSAAPGGPGMPGNDIEAMGQIPDESGVVPGPPPPPMENGSPVQPGPTNADWGTDFADRLERVVQTLLEQSNMPKRCRDVAWSMCAMDGAVIGAWPDIRHGRPRIITRTPQDFYPVAYDPDGLELQLAMWKDTLSGPEVVARYGEQFAKKYFEQTEVEVIQAIDEKNFYTVLDQSEWAHEPMQNLAEIVPIVCVGSLGLPGMIFGSTELKDALPVARQVNYHVELIEEMAAAMVRPTIAIKDPINVPEGIAIGRGGTITMGPNGNVELLGPIQLPNAFWQLSNTLERWFDIISDNPNVLRSDDGGGMTTGAGFNAKLGPLSSRMQQRLEILMAAWKQAIKYMLIMWDKFPGMKAVDAAGISEKETFFLNAQPSDFHINGKIWTEMDVFLRAQSYMDSRGNAVEIMQLYQNELIDWDTAVDNLYHVTNKKRTRSRIDKDRQWKAEGMATAQQAAQSAMTANVAPAAQEKTNYGMERGFLGEMPAMPAPTAGPIEGSVPGEMEEPEMEGEGMVEVLTDFFNNIPKLKGRVWWGGDPVLAPQKLDGDDWTVTVWVEQPIDKGTITRAAENVEVVYGHIRFENGQPAPDEQAIMVQSETAGVNEPEIEEPENPLVGMLGEM